MRLLRRRVDLRITCALLAAADVALIAYTAPMAARYTAMAVVVGALAAAFVACVFVFVREQTHCTFVGDDGVVQRVLGREVKLQFDEVDAVYLDKKRVGEELAARALAEAMDRFAHKDDGGFNERTTNVTVTVWGDGKRIVLTSNTKGVGAFYREVVSRTQPRLLHEARRTLDVDGAVSFGPITVKRDGVHARGKVLPFAELETVDVDEGVLRVMSRTGWFTPSATPVAAVPNFEVFKSLVRRSA